MKQKCRGTEPPAVGLQCPFTGDWKLADGQTQNRPNCPKTLGPGLLCYTWEDSSKGTSEDSPSTTESITCIYKGNKEQSDEEFAKFGEESKEN